MYNTPISVVCGNKKKSRYRSVQCCLLSTERSQSGSRVQPHPGTHARASRAVVDSAVRLDQRPVLRARPRRSRSSMRINRGQTLRSRDCVPRRTRPSNGARFSALRRTGTAYGMVQRGRERGTPWRWRLVVRTGSCGVVWCRRRGGGGDGGDERVG
jgi:hypothetical protein